MSPTRLGLLLLCLCLCVSPASSWADKVKWHQGTVEQAFATARKGNKPLFLYWGARWCPPCNEIKRTVFGHPAFVRTVAGFVAVYLDGDTGRAQRWGEQLKTSRYPAMLILAPTGEELLRIPTGVRPERFVQLMKTAAARMRPVKALVAEALAGRASPQTWKLLAHYDWDHAAGLDVDKVLPRLLERLPRTKALAEARARLRLLQLSRRVQQGKQRPLTPEEAREAARLLTRVLSRQGTTLANLELLLYGCEELLPALKPAGQATRRELAARWRDAARRLEASPALSAAERLAALLPQVIARQLTRPRAPLPAALRQKILQGVRKAIQATRTHETRIAAMYVAAKLLRQARLHDEAERFLRQEVARSRSPWFFMTALASLARERKRPAEALRWARRAHRAARGPATRFQWGVQHLQALMELRPDDAARVRRVTREVLGELLAAGDAFSGRNADRLQRLAAAFAAWNAGGKRARQVAPLRRELTALCRRRLKAGPSRGRCEAYAGALGEKK